MGRKPIIAIEHLEDTLGIWLFLEYRHSCLIAGNRNIIITNLPAKYHHLLRRYCSLLEEKSVLELYPHEKMIILDPQAPEELSIKDLESAEVVVVGGILGDHPPRGRTKKLLSSRAPRAIKRNIGEGQYSIDGTVYVVTRFLETGTLSSIKYVNGIVIRDEVQGVVREIKLPFRYPMVDNKPLITPGLREYLLYGRLPKEIRKELAEKIK